jgi:3-oxoacyl-ACP reductase-like protein
MAKTPQEMKAAMIARLAESTGKSLEQWLQILKPAGLTKHKEIVNELKTRHGLTHGFANMIALQALGTDSHTAADSGSLIDAQYAGARSALRPICDAVLAAVATFGRDIEMSPKKAYISLRRSKQFAILQPSTNSRLDAAVNQQSAIANL